MSNSLHITASYTFVAINEARLESLKQDLLTFGTTRDMKGLILIATEGINSTVSGSASAISEWKAYLTEHFGEMTFKDSTAERQIFGKWSVKIKPEIVALKKPSIQPHGTHRHLTPAEWHAMLQRDDVVVLDARNSYEVKIGKFKNAIDPGIQSFHELLSSIQKGIVPKDKKVLMYCTGGIRCEKALLAMEAEGYQDVYQLEGGILAYLEQFPHGAFEGECFVFDERVAVDQELQPSRAYKLCPDCGDPVRL